MAIAQTASQTITEQDARAIAVDAYLYFYSLVTMDVTRKQLTNVEPAKLPGRGPMNMFNNVRPIRPPTIGPLSVCTMRRLGPSLSTAATPHTIAASLLIPVGNLDNAGALGELFYQRVRRRPIEAGYRTPM